MPAITKNQYLPVRTGMICDCCGQRDEENFNDFTLNHTCGYASPCDGLRVEATICDACLIKIVVTCIPGAILADSSGISVSHGKLAEIVDSLQGEQD